MKLRIALTIALSLCLSACVDPYEVQKPEPVILEDHSHPLITIVYSDANIKYYVRTENQDIDNSANLPRCVVQLKNYAPQQVPVEYQFKWHDSFGAPITTSSAWQRTFMSANGEKAIVDMAKSPNARTVKLHLRFPQDVQIYLPYPDPADFIKQAEQK